MPTLNEISITDATTADIAGAEAQITITRALPLPPISSSTSQEYGDRLNALTARAFIKEPLTICFACERLNIAKIEQQHILSGYGERITTKLRHGATIVEAGNWAAAAVWEPPGFDSGLAPVENRPIFAGFLQKVAEAKIRYFGDQQYWHLAMMAREPGNTTKGAVRAVVEPYLLKAKERDVPICLEAGSLRARDVYAYLGFRVLEEIRTGKGKIGADGYIQNGGPGVLTWLMAYNLVM